VMDAKKVLIIFGSPRKNGNTHILVEEACKGLAVNGTSTETFYLNEMQIKGCQACYYCKKNKVDTCILKDDMQKIYAAVKNADGILIASPIYFGEVSAQTKLWLDRMFPFIDMQVHSLLAKGKKASFIFTQNQPVAGLFANNIESFVRMVEHIGFAAKDRLVAYNLDKGYKPMVTENKQFMQKAFELGRDLLS
jgi:multimeric flavodoxin WrbA